MAFIGVYIINRTLHGRLEIRNFSSHVEKNISLICVIFQHSKRNFISLRSHVISSIKNITIIIIIFIIIIVVICIIIIIIIVNREWNDVSELVHGTSIRQLANNNFIVPHLNIIIFMQQLPNKHYWAVFRQSIMSRFEVHLKLQLKQKERQQMINKTQIWAQSKLLFNIIFSISGIAHSTFYLLIYTRVSSLSPNFNNKQLQTWQQRELLYNFIHLHNLFLGIDML